MKKKLFIILVNLSSFIYINAQSIDSTKDILSSFFKSKDTLTSKFEKFDVQYYSRTTNYFKKNNIDSPIKFKSLKKEEKNYKKIFFDGSDLIYYDSTKKLKKLISEGSMGFFEKKFITPYFFIYKLYFKNGNIMQKAIVSTMGFAISKAYNYKSNGKLLSIIDTDEGYNFNYEDVFNFCVENKIPMLGSLNSTTIKKNSQ